MINIKELIEDTGKKTIAVRLKTERPEAAQNTTQATQTITKKEEKKSPTDYQNNSNTPKPLNIK